MTAVEKRSDLRSLAALALLAATFCCQIARGQTTGPGPEAAPDVGVRFHPLADVVLQGATVVASPGEAPATLDILVRDGKIAQIAAELEVPPGTEAIDCSGKFIYAAFVDSLVEVETTVQPATAGHWNDQVTPEHRSVDSLEVKADTWSTLRKAGIATILAAPTQGLIKGQSCVVTTGDHSLAQRLLRDVAFMHIRLSPDSHSREVYPNSPMGATALVRQTFYDAQWYVDSTRVASARPLLPSPAFNSALAALHPAISGQQPIVVDAGNELYALRADRLARQHGLALLLRGSGREYRRLDAIAETNRTILLPVDFPKAPKVTTEQQAAAATLQSLMHWRLAPENPARLAARQVDFVITSDGLESPIDLLKNVRVAIKRGLSPERALTALTLRPAQLLGVEHLTGTLERGKLANLLVTDGELFAEKTKLLETWVQGKRFEHQPKLDSGLTGSWNLDIDSNALVQAELEVTGKPSAPKVKLIPPATDKQASAEDSESEEDSNETDEDSTDIRLKDIQADRFSLTATFQAKPITGEPGIALLSATLTDAGEKPHLDGHIRWPDGTRSAFSGRRPQLEPENESSRNEESSEPTEPDEADESDDESDDTVESENEASTTEATSEPTEVDCPINYPLGAYGVPAEAKPPRWCLIRGATIWTCSDEGILENADMLVRGGIIDSIGHNLVAPEGAVLIDGTGKHLTPGIIDCHSHMATDGGVNESGQAVTAEVRIGDFIDPNDITIYRHLAGGVTTSNILHGSANPIGGQNQVIKLRWGALGEQMKMREAPAGIKFALGENVKQSNWGDDHTSRYPQTRMGVPEIMRDRFEAALEYQRRREEWTKQGIGLPVRRDLELDAIAEILTGQRWIHCHSYRQDEILAFLKLLDEYDVTVGSLQHILEGYKVADAMAAHGATGSSFSDWWGYKFEVRDAIPYNGAIMHRAGIIVSFNSDDRELARHLNHEAAKAIKYGGLSPEEALNFVTLNPAKQLRIDQYVGSLEPGKHADFVLWNGSPLSTLSLCEQTWIDGAKYFDRNEDLQRRSEDAELHRRLVQAVLSSGEGTGGDDADDPSSGWARHDAFCGHEHVGHNHEEHHHATQLQQGASAHAKQ